VASRRSTSVIRAAQLCLVLGAALALAASGGGCSSSGARNDAGAGGGGAGEAGTGGAGTAGSGGVGALGGAGGGGAAGGGGESPAFTVVTPDVTLPPSATVSYCYYFHAQNAAALAVKKWTSDMTPGTHHLILYGGSAGQPPDGTLSTAACGVGTGNTLPSWLFASHTAHGELTLPADDGAGKPVGMALSAGQPMFIQMYFVNATTNAVAAHVTLSGYAYPAGTTYTQTDAFVTYNSMISIGPQATGVVVSKTCNVPSGAKFWWVSTESHMQSTATDLKDGVSMLLMSTNWEHPAAMTWLAAPFYTFASGAMTYECTYNNTGANTGNVIHSGSSFQTDEVCMGVGYFFPSTGPKFCLDGTPL
jgi:hypothetical protein